MTILIFLKNHWRGSLSVLLTFLLALSIVILLQADDIGKAIGRAQGNLVGTAVGSYNGITEGISSGKRDGKEEGLSAADTTAAFKTAVSEVGNLQVLAANVRLKNLHEIGQDYKALYLLRGSAVFTVDLGQASIIPVDEENLLLIRLPRPKMELYIDEAETEKISEYQKHFFSGDAADGFTAYLNSMRETVEVSRDNIVQYDALMEAACRSAEKQVRFLAEQAGQEGREISIDFKNPEDTIHG